MAVVPQALGLLEELTVGRERHTPGRLGKVRGAGDDPLALMRQLAVDQLADRHPSEISLGEQQRASVARAAIVRPRLLLADEPIAHQDLELAQAVMFGCASWPTAAPLPRRRSQRAGLRGRRPRVELHDGQLRLRA